MKKLYKTTLVVLVSLLVLVGCGGSAISQVTDSDELLADIKGTKITKGDIYEYNKLRFGTALVKNNLIKMEITKHIELTEEEITQAKTQLEESKEKMGENFEMIIQASGYKDEEDYFENYILTEIKGNKLFEGYLDEYLENIVTETHSYKVRKLFTSTKAEAEAALEELKALEEITPEKFVEIATKYNTNTNEDFVIGEAKVESVYEGRTESKYLTKYLEADKIGLIPEMEMIESGFAIIYIEKLDLEADKEQITASIKANEKVLTAVRNSMYATYATIGNFQIHDKDIYEDWSANNPFITK